MSNTCPDCGTEFSRKDAIMRHQRNKHRISQPYPRAMMHIHRQPTAGTTTTTPTSGTTYLFTIMLAGPTGAGKTFWMQTLLKRARTMIKPSPERIIWCYKRWQPLFTEMQQTIKNLLFVQGLPENLNDDSFIDSRF
ncbi:Hypothetical predicted protein [Mytilus galloprovincialis]|uniref:C2H2-type domain-containing protein n=1 Tax=Mytilus galloprovincialis TaxID=29158 RepID=A0A8B6EEB3_MYTGA|nr:Hypothetical predicted protein [Mytilus galloprovincialis]